MTKVSEEVERWFQDRPKWLQDAARRLIQNGALTEQDFEELFAICIKEAMDQPVAYTCPPSGAFDTPETAKSLRLKSIFEVRGINALAPSKPLEFGEAPICIVYGRNGAGKSGYVRLLKHACGTRHPGELLCNVFVEGSQPQAAKLSILDGDEPKMCSWNGGTTPELQGVDIYDTGCGLVYVNEENEVTFEPWLLRFFTELTNACSTLSKLIQEKIGGQVSKKPVLPTELAQTKAARWYADLSYNTTTAQVEEGTAWQSHHDATLKDINRRLTETDPATKAADLRRRKALVTEVEQALKQNSDGLSDEGCKSYLKKKDDAEAKRRAADEDAKKIFEGAPLAGVGSESWRLLWEAARKYSVESAYKAEVFPYLAEDARCVLCQRELDQESRSRLASFEAFVKGELQKLALTAEQTLQKATETFPDLQSAEAIAIKLEAAGITDGPMKTAAQDFVKALTERKEKCLAAKSLAELPGLPKKQLLINLLRIARGYAAQARAYEKDAAGIDRPKLELEAKDLSARKWLHQQRQAIDYEIERLTILECLKAADELTNTQALSKKKSALTGELITNTYITRFHDELRRLKAAGLSVELKKTKAEVGRVYHRISLKKATRDVKTSDILSEGEFRIVSLAAFLADTEGRGAKTPFVFDDPISSLDQVYETATAQRLVELSKSRQVIVFTHRLSLVGALEKYAEKAGTIPNLVCLSQYMVGEPTGLPINLKRTDRAANALANERLAAAKKAFAQGDAIYENEAKGLCRDIRILLERIVEADLLNEIIKRYSPEVNTKGKIHHLAKITPADCQFIDDYMTKYSLYEHSQPEEVLIELPKPDEIEADMKAIIEFIVGLKARAKS